MLAVILFVPSFNSHLRTNGVGWTGEGQGLFRNSCACGAAGKGVAGDACSGWKVGAHSLKQLLVHVSVI